MAGIVHLDVAALEALNAVHPMITLARCRRFKQWQAGDGRHDQDYSPTCGQTMTWTPLARQVAAAIRMLAATDKDATLIITEIDARGDRAKKQDSDRLSHWMSAPERTS